MKTNVGSLKTSKLKVSNWTTSNKPVDNCKVKSIVTRPDKNSSTAS